MLSLCVLLPLAAFAAEPTAATPKSPSRKALAALVQGRADQAISLLAPILAANPADAEARNLLCRVYATEERDDDAIRECSAAASASPSNSEYQRWLGRAYGGKAQRSSAFTALKLAKHVRDGFQRAAQLDPSNAAALADLGEYFVEAPAALGGGGEKARPLLAPLLRLDPALGHWLAARIAEEGKDPSTAEAEYKLEVESASPTATTNGSGSSKAQALADLASFYHKQHRDPEAVALVRAVSKTDALQDGALVAAAGTLRAIKTEPALTIQMLRSYLTSARKTEEYPAFQVDVLLGRFLSQQGDKAGAARQFAAALDLARDYAPARKAQDGLR